MGQISNNTFITHFMFGLFSNVCIIYLIRYHSTDWKIGILSGQNLLAVIAFCSILSATILSTNYNKTKAFSCYHPLYLFFKLLFSKAVLIPALLFPLGALTGQILSCLIYKNMTIYSLVKFGVFFTLVLWVIGILGSFIGIFILNRK